MYSDSDVLSKLYSDSDVLSKLYSDSDALSNHSLFSQSLSPGVTKAPSHSKVYISHDIACSLRLSAS